jgi:hypothetical protein
MRCRTRVSVTAGDDARTWAAVGWMLSRAAASAAKANWVGDTRGHRQTCGLGYTCEAGPRRAEASGRGRGIKGAAANFGGFGLKTKTGQNRVEGRG